MVPLRVPLPYYTSPQSPFLFKQHIKPECTDLRAPPGKFSRIRQFAKIEQNLRYFDFVNCQLSHAQSDRITQKVQFQFKLIEMFGEKIFP